MLAQKRADLVRIIEDLISARFTDYRSEKAAIDTLRLAVPHPDPLALIFHDPWDDALTAEQVLALALAYDPVGSPPQFLPLAA
ncbi:hypothetical protein [Roseicella aquatilis]|uniref:Uncharacterized protein n=1 Tax=Roseicella aquatilis TaxID=2527868 RepID=A0A4R4DNY1_9PROT|nr:hypothetical protein [Roseicella aquatilis]TCZ63242.1 hypothetical protein EXY23_10445 [Roseicella aquatilis]